MQRASECSTFTYDGSLPLTETRQGAAPASLAWTYNTDFAPTSFTYAGETQTYGYDADGLVLSAAPFQIARRADSALPTTVTAPGFALSRSYNEYGEIDSADYGAYAYTLTRDASGRITSKAEETHTTTRTWDYTYDTLGRLAAVTLDGQLAESYAYDESGNRTAHRAPLRGIDTTLAASFDTEDRATSVGDATYTYTPDGYLALKHSSEGTTTFAYSAFGELESVTLADGREVTYTYDAAGRRTSKAIDGTPTQRYLWADTTRLLAVYDGAGAIRMRLLYADARVPYAADTPAGRVFFAYDQVGSLRAVTDEAGAVLKTVVHDSFGNVTSDSNPALAVPLGFAGGLTDADTGLTLFGARDYDPALGRWIAKDPIGFAGGDANLYGYCLGDPVGLVDPSGLMNWDANAFAKGVAIGVATVAIAAIVAVTIPVSGPAALVLGGLGVIGAGVTGFALGSSAVGVFTGKDSFGNCVSAEDASFGLGISLVGAASIGAATVADRSFSSYWRYVGPESNPSGRFLTRGARPPYGENLSLAEGRLQIPNATTHVERIPVRWNELVAGPRRVTGNPEFGAGGGLEWYRNWRFPR